MRLSKLFSVLSVLTLCSALTIMASAEQYDVSKDSVIIHAEGSHQYVTYLGTTVEDRNPVVIGQTQTNQRQTGNSIQIFTDASTQAAVTLSNVDVDLSSEFNRNAMSVIGEGTAMIQLNGRNTLSSGTLNAGILTDCSMVYFLEDTNSAGTLIAKGGTYGAGIGGNCGMSGNHITILSGNIQAYAGPYGAGIGGGQGGTGSYITICSGTVTAASSNIDDSGFGAGIGGGQNGNGTAITISGGSVMAQGSEFGAGIGGGQNGSAEQILITGGNLKAIGGEHACGIGSGWGTGNASALIQGGKLHAAGTNALGSADGTSSDIQVRSRQGSMQISDGTSILDTIAPGSLYTYQLTLPVVSIQTTLTAQLPDEPVLPETESADRDAPEQQTETVSEPSDAASEPSTDSTVPDIASEEAESAQKEADSSSAKAQDEDNTVTDLENHPIAYQKATENHNLTITADCLEGIYHLPVHDLKIYHKLGIHTIILQFKEQSCSLNTEMLMGCIDKRSQSFEIRIAQNSVRLNLDGQSIPVS